MNNSSKRPQRGLTRRSFLHIAAIAGLVGTAGAARFFLFLLMNPGFLQSASPFL